MSSHHYTTHLPNTSSRNPIQTKKTDPTTTAKLKDLRSQLCNLFHHSFEYHIKRICLSFYALNNKPGAFLAKQYKRKAAASKIPFATANHNRKIFNPSEITNHFRNFYSSLYNQRDAPTSSPLNPDTLRKFLDSINLPTISETQLAEL